MAKPRKESKAAKVARLKARLEVLTGKNTGEMRASLQAHIDELTGKPAKSGEGST